MPNLNISGLLGARRFGGGRGASDPRWRDWRQGDFIKNRLLGRRGRMAPKHSVHGHVVVSQTCDVVLEKRPTVSFAPVRMLDESEKRIATRDNPRYVALDHLGQPCYVDLAYIFTLEKQRLSPGIDRIPLPQSVQRKLSNSVARWFGRFPFPDEVVPWLRPLERTVREKHDRPNSALGQALQDVVEIRVQADSWLEENREITLHFILKSGTIAPVDFSDVDSQGAVTGKIPEPQIRQDTDPNALAAQLLKASYEQKGEIWKVLADLLAEKCRPSQEDMRSPGVVNAVKSVVARVCDDHEFSLADWRNSERLDVDYLSAPVPE